MSEYVAFKMIRDRVRSRKPAAAANWFRDPRGEAPYRYWDGAQWTDETADALP